MRLFLNFLAAAAFAAFILIILVEWMVGCGEAWTDANGKVHIGECVFISRSK